MRKILFGILFIIVFSYCEKGSDSNDCNPDNPLSMTWMDEWVSEMQYCRCIVSIFQAEYDGQAVFWQMMTDPLCQTFFTAIQVYDCTGEELLLINSAEDLQDFQEKINGMKIIYQCKKR